VSDRLGRARERLEEIERWKPQVAELAKLASLAVRIEPELLRALRLQVAPQLDVGAEADLWFSPLVQARGADGITFSAEVAEVLREKLRQDARFPLAWRVIEECHRTISPALRLEEKVAWLALNDGTVEAIEEALAPALVSLVKEGRAGIAAWAARALLHLPSKARSTRVAWILSLTASRSLGGRVILEEGAPVHLLEEDLSIILPDLGEVDLGVRRKGDNLELGDLHGEGVSTIRVGDTVPRLVEVRWQDEKSERREVVIIAPSASVKQSVGGDLIRLRALNGTVYELRAPLKLLPRATNPWRIAIRRRHTPKASKRYQDFRSCLRWEFGFSCAFCLLHETDLTQQGVEGWGLMQIEHHVPRSQAPEVANEYTNSFYICRFCNEARGAASLVSHDGRRLLNPCEIAWQECFELDGDEIRVVGGNPDAIYTLDVYDLNDPRKVRMRRKRRQTLSELVDVVTKARPLRDRLLQRAVETGDPTLVDDARTMWKNLLYARKDLLRFVPIPEDASPSCACGHNRHHTLPEVLEEQLLTIDPSDFFGDADDSQ
jgi:hypothetical protein